MLNAFDLPENKRYRVSCGRVIARRPRTLAKPLPQSRRDSPTPILVVAFVFWAVYFLLRFVAP